MKTFLIRLVIEFLIEAFKRIPKKRKKKKKPKKIPFGEYLENAKEREKNRTRPKPNKIELDENPY
jgi:hypothetical protein